MQRSLRNRCGSPAWGPSAIAGLVGLGLVAGCAWLPPDADRASLDSNTPSGADDSGEVVETDADGDGFSVEEDCDDTDAAVHPDADERCDDEDWNCDGDTEAGAIDADTLYLDADGDFFGAEDSAFESCAEVEGTVLVGGDCDDTDDAVNPNAEEDCATEADDDCDGLVDEQDALGCTMFYVDADEDGYGSTLTACWCSLDVGLAEQAFDCDDADADVNPGTGTCGLVLNGEYSLPDEPVGVITLTGEEVGDFAGGSIAPLGDTNGDGYQDLLVSAHGHDDWAGAAYVVLGPATSSGSLLASSEALYGTSYSGSGSELGYDLSGAGDFNGDGISDLVLAAPDYCCAGGTITDGAAFIVLGPITGGIIDELANAVGVNFSGTAVAGIGDVDGDGCDEVALGNAWYDGRAEYAGEVLIEYGDPSGLPAFSYAPYGTSSGAEVGFDVEGIGDFDGDGHDDLMVAAKGLRETYVVTNPSTVDMATYAHLTILTDGVGNGYPLLVGPGDLDGDGWPDLVIGDAELDLVGVIYGPASGTLDLATESDVLYTGDDYFVRDVAEIGDYDRDGDVDLLVAGTGAPSSPWVWLFEGPLSSGTAETATASISGLGGSPTVSGAGDMDGDGFGDLAIGLDSDSTASGGGEGAVHLLLSTQIGARR